MSWLTWPAIIAGAVPTYFAARAVYDDVYQRVRVWQSDQIVLDEQARTARLATQMHVPADEHGRSGWMMQPDMAGVNLDTYTRLGPGGRIEEIDAMRERLNHLERMLLAAPQPVGDVVQQVDGPDMPRIPEFVPTEQALTDSPSYRRLVLGRTEHEAVTADLASLVHVAVGGSIGWGKSMFLRWLVYQLARSTDPVDLAFIDLENATLAPFAHSSHALWPVADTESDALAIMRELTGELDRRKELYRTFEEHGVDSLYAYNEISDEPLVPIVTIIDEATALMENKDVEGHLRTLALRARKYGLWLVLAGQDWKASTLDTSIRNQLGARIQFRAMDATQSRVLLNRPGAELLDVKGRAIAVLPGRTPVEFQAPMVKASEIRAMHGRGPVNEKPTAMLDHDATDGPMSPENVARVLDLHAQGLPQYKIEDEVYGYHGGRAHTYVADIIKKRSTTIA
jgi:hypothetical protein